MKESKALNMPLIVDEEQRTPLIADKEQQTPLEKHIAYFAEGDDGMVSFNSMRSQLMAMGEDAALADQTARTVTLVGGISVSHCPFSHFSAKAAVGRLNHARDTGIYNLDGTLNEDRWNMLHDYSETVYSRACHSSEEKESGVQIITERRFYEFLEKCRAEDPRWDVFGFAKSASDGEWSKFFEMCSDYWKGSDATAERCVTLGTLREFFENTPLVFDRVVAHELPKSRP